MLQAVALNTCASSACFAEFWQRYVRWCEANHPDGAANALQRATAVFCKRQPGIFIFAARFYEAKGDAAAAREQLKQLLTDVAPGLLEVGSRSSGTSLHRA